MDILHTPDDLISFLAVRYLARLVPAPGLPRFSCWIIFMCVASMLRLRDLCADELCDSASRNLLLLFLLLCCLCFVCFLFFFVCLFLLCCCSFAFCFVFVCASCCCCCFCSMWALKEKYYSDSIDNHLIEHM